MRKRKIRKKEVAKKVIRIIRVILFYLLIFLAFTTIFGTKWALREAQINNFEQILLTLTNSVSTASTEMIISFIKECILISLLLTIIIFFITKFFKNLEVFINIKIKKIIIKINFYKIISFIFLIVLITYAIYYASSGLYIYDYIKYSNIESNFFETLYVDPKEVDLEFPEEKRNLIYIFLESMESTYADKENGGAYDINYMPELTNLAKNNINFSSNNLVGGAHMAYNASWTMAAMVSHTAGIPLKTVFNQDDVSTYEAGTTLPGAYSLGDILKKEEYRQYIMVGSDLTFGGRRNYFKNHGNYTEFDYYTAIEDGIIDEDYYVFWGYEDEKLFDYAKKELKEISKSDEPFNFTMLTVDTHFPDGYVDNSCKDIYDDNYLTSIDCSSEKLDEFINWIKKQDFYENTTIILVGDHLSMNTYSFDEIDPNYDRSVYNVFINSAVDTDCNKNRNFTTFDYYPTTLAALGVKIKGERLGLGTNLFSCKETLSEEFGNDYIDEKLMEYSPYYESCIGKKCKKEE